MYQMAQCSNCPHQYPVNLVQLARQASRWACPVCGAVTDFAERQINQPGTSMEAKQFWGLVALGGIAVGLVMLADRFS